jgi:membrane associated rhomboid family serine protease
MCRPSQWPIDKFLLRNGAVDFESTLLTCKGNMRKSIVVPLFLFINGIVFMLWQFRETVELMYQHFLVSYTGLMSGQYHTLVTSVFSHNMLLHFFINMFVLHSFGPFLERYLGSLRFVTLYLIFGIMGSLSHCLTSEFLLSKPDLPALGASGAIAGIIMVFSLSFPKEKILLFGIIPMPAIFGAFAFVGLDLWGLYEQSGGSGLPIGHGAHLGGAFAAILAHVFYIRPKRRKRLL